MTEGVEVTEGLAMAKGVAVTEGVDMAKGVEVTEGVEMAKGVAVTEVTVEVGARPSSLVLGAPSTVTDPNNL